MEEKIKEIHHHHYYYPCYISQPPRYPNVWHGILPPPDYNVYYEPNWHYEPRIKTTTKGIERYDSI